MGTNRMGIQTTTEASDCPFLREYEPARGTACSTRRASTPGGPSRCQTEDHDGCPTFLATVLTRTRPSYRRFDDLGFSAK